MANEFVARRGIISLGGVTFPYYPTSVNYTASTDDFFIDITSSGVTVELPTVIGVEGKQYAIRNSSSGNTTIDCYLNQRIEQDQTVTLGSGNTIQVISDSDKWRIVSVGGPIRTSTNNSLLTSDGTIGGVNANTGLTFDGQTLRNLVPQTSASTYIESYSLELTGFTATTGYTRVFQIPKNNVAFLEIDYALRKGLQYKTGSLKRSVGVTGQTLGTNVVQSPTTLISFPLISADTTDIFVSVRVTSGTEVVDNISLNSRLVKFI